MSDDRMTDLLRVVDQPDEPSGAFLDRLYDELTVDLAFRAPAPTSAARRHRSTRWWVLMAALLALTLVGSTVIAGAAIQLLRHDANALDAIRSAGVMQVLVRDGSPQARSPQRILGGFDIDVATELATRLGVRADAIAVADDHTWADVVHPMDVDRLLSMSSSVRRPDPERDLSSVPILFWPIALLVAADSDIESPDGLDGGAICVVEGTAGEAWLSGTAGEAAITFTHGPPPATAVARPDDESCLDALADGTVMAVVTADLSPADLVVRGGIRALPGVVITEERSLFVGRDAGDVEALLAELDAAIEAARADGTLADLSRSRFGGHDLSVPPSTTPKEE